MICRFLTLYDKTDNREGIALSVIGFLRRSLFSAACPRQSRTAIWRKTYQPVEKPPYGRFSSNPL
ncbi:MAG: hypothetical protein NC203_10410 [Firmicutes bacterium]|nr:hypothetical protein [[Eubacterium] siraeum]MCM1488764.1 hypothetical protein [Bacillota bacterium]